MAAWAALAKMAASKGGGKGGAAGGSKGGLMGGGAGGALEGTKKIPENKYAELASGGGDEGRKYHKGGKVRKTGPARLLKGEQVLSRKSAKKYRRKRGSKNRGKE